MAKLTDNAIIAQTLVREISAMNAGFADNEDWTSLLKFYVLDLLALDNSEELGMREKLATAMTMIGSRSLDHYPHASQLLSEWSFVGGCFWVVQLEILRHACLHIIRNSFCNLNQVDFQHSSLKSAITDMLTGVPCDSDDKSTHTIVKLKMSILRADMFWLLDSMQKSTYPYDELVNYYAEYELSKFVPWFLSWAFKLMNRSEHAFSPQSLAVSEILRIKTIARRNEMHDYTGSYGVATAIDIDIEQKSDYMDSNLSTRVPSRPPKRKIQECKDRDPEDENDELLRHINDEATGTAGKGKGTGTGTVKCNRGGENGSATVAGGFAATVGTNGSIDVNTNTGTYHPRVARRRIQECKEAAIDDSEGGKVINGEALIHHPAQVLLPAERQNTPPQRSILRQLMHDLWEAISPIPQQTDSNVDDSADDSEFDLSLADPNDGNASTGTAHSDYNSTVEIHEEVIRSYTAVDNHPQQLNTMGIITGTNKATDNSLAISSSAGSSSSLAYSTYSNAYF